MEEGGGDGGKMEVEVWKQQRAEIREEKREIQFKLSGLSWWCVHRLEEEFQFQKGSECSGRALKENVILRSESGILPDFTSCQWGLLSSDAQSDVTPCGHEMFRILYPRNYFRFNPAGGADATFWMPVVPPTVGWAPERLQHGGPAARQMWLLRGEKETFL